MSGRFPKNLGLVLHFDDNSTFVEGDDMPKHADINKILIIGSGPVIVGQTGELDQASAQACDALRSMGYNLIIAHSDPAAAITDFSEKEKVYIEPLDIDRISQIIACEKPEAVMVTVGGQTALNLAADLIRKGEISAAACRLLGMSQLLLDISVDRKQFKAISLPNGIEHSRSEYARSSIEAVSKAEQFTYPIVVRAATSKPGIGIGLVYNIEELQAAVKIYLDNPLNEEIILEESLYGGQEFELIIVRDFTGEKVVWAVLENLDPVGIHYGDSVITTPPKNISDKTLDRMIDAGVALADVLGVIGTLTFRFAFDCESDRLVLLNISPKASRSTALAGITTTIPIHSVTAYLAGGMTLAEMPWRTSVKKGIQRLPTENTVVKVPKWPFDTFKATADHLNIYMQAMGEVVGIGPNFNTAFMNAYQSLDRNFIPAESNLDTTSSPKTKLPGRTDYLSSKRYFHIYSALAAGESIAELNAITRISPAYLKDLKELVEIASAILNHKEKSIPDKILSRAIANGFPDCYLASGFNCTLEDIRKKRQELSEEGLVLSSKLLNRYPRIAEESKRNRYIIIGPGPNGLGYDVGYDHSIIWASKALRDSGFDVVRVNCNPASISSRNDGPDLVYIAPPTPQEIDDICRNEKAQGILIQFSGPKIASQAQRFYQAGLPIVGLNQETFEVLTSPSRLRHLINELGIAQPEFQRVQSYSALQKAVKQMGYPLSIRPESGAATNDPTSLLSLVDDHALHRHFNVEKERLGANDFLVERFLEYATECEVDVLCDGKEIFIPTVLEHIELAGVHSADSAFVTPPYSTSLRHVDTMHVYTRKIARKLALKGVMTLRFAVLNDTVYVLDVKPWANRTLPWSSKICNVPMAYAATQILLGKSIRELNLSSPTLPYFGIREAVFPFADFPQVDPLLGPYIYSTGSVMALDHSFGCAYFKSQEAILTPLPLAGTVLITVTDADKPSILEPARLFKEMGFTIKATQGTHTFLAGYGIESETVRKLGFGRPNLVDAIKTGEIDLVINTPSGKQSQIDDADIRKAAIQCRVPNITTPAGALAAAKGITARLEAPPQIKPLGEYHQLIRN